MGADRYISIRSFLSEWSKRAECFPITVMAVCVDLAGLEGG